MPERTIPTSDKIRIRERINKLISDFDFDEAAKLVYAVLVCGDRKFGEFLASLFNYVVIAFDNDYVVIPAA